MVEIVGQSRVTFVWFYHAVQLTESNTSLKAYLENRTRTHRKPGLEKNPDPNLKKSESLF